MDSIVSNTGLAVDALIQVRVRARNADGWGVYSEINTSGAKVETIPSYSIGSTLANDALV